MKKNVLAFFMLTGVLLTGCSNGNYQGYTQSNVNMQVREISATSGDVNETLNNARSAVVGISVSLDDGYAIGSGVAISDKGYILTNFHVVEGGDEITLYYADKTTGTAEIVWGNSGLDMAILKSSKEIPYLSTVDIDDIFIGDEVYAIGTPLTLEFKHTVTKGIVSAMDRVLESESTYGSSFLQSLIQHDASINPGNSGGPLIDSKGRVIGINTLKASEGEGIGFAIPIRLGKVVIDKLIENPDYESPYLGIFGFDSSIAEVYGNESIRSGVYVVSVQGGAKTSGLKKGDIITSVDGEEITNMLDLRVEIYKHNIGDTIEVKYLRDGEEFSTQILLSQR